jgi:hypothetical protein
VQAAEIGYLPTVEERVRWHLEDGTETLYICPNAWAIRHGFVDASTGEVRRFRCNLWTCPHCGPRKVNEWRQLIAEAAPTLHLVLTKAGQTVDEAARALTTFMQALRRGSKGRGKNRVGMRPAYPVEYFAVLERHENFEENGFHWHVLLRGVEHIPYEEVIKPLWRSARHGKAELGWIQRIQNVRAIGYVTKYLTKDILRTEKGRKQVAWYKARLVWDAGGGKLIEDVVSMIDEKESLARRIRYSRGFFPESVKALRHRLFSPAESSEGDDEGERDEASFPGTALGPTLGTQEREEKSSWVLRELVPAFASVGQYQAWEQKVLTDVLTEREVQGKRLSRRVLSAWRYQCEQGSPGSARRRDRREDVPDE